MFLATKSRRVRRLSLVLGLLGGCYPVITGDFSKIVANWVNILATSMAAASYFCFTWAAVRTIAWVASEREAEDHQTEARQRRE